MIYSKRHSLNGVTPIDITTLAPIYLTPAPFSLFDISIVSMPTEAETVAKLEAIGIGAAFISGTQLEMFSEEFLAEFDELVKDFDAMIGDDLISMFDQQQEEIQ